MRESEPMGSWGEKTSCVDGSARSSLSNKCRTDQVFLSYETGSSNSGDKRNDGLAYHQVGGIPTSRNESSDSPTTILEESTCSNASLTMMDPIQPKQPMKRPVSATGGASLVVEDEEEEVAHIAVPKKRRVAEQLKAQERRVAEQLNAQELASLAPPSSPPKKMVLLSRPSDEDVLNPFHVFVRRQIEVFTATHTEIQQPAPGRKMPIQLKQVGLRCIHCSHLFHRDRVKRAICYPSSVGRIYNCVSDMKFDHFTICKGMTGEIREEFERLKEGTKKRKEGKSDNKKTSSQRVAGSSSSSSTAQYYHDAACQMGLTDAKGGIYYVSDAEVAAPRAPCATNPSLLKAPTDCAAAANLPLPDTAATAVAVNVAPAPSVVILPSGVSTSDSAPLGATANDAMLSLITVQHLSLPKDLASGILMQQEFYQRALQQQYALNMTTNQKVAAIAATNALNVPSPGISDPQEAHEKCDQSESIAVLFGPLKPTRTPSAGVILATPDDPKNLNPIHCFVRRHVELFSADSDDVTAPSPGRKTRIQLGQVGLRCVHCARLPPKERVKRAFCYPPSVSGVYHSVSNMKFDHFAKCRGLPTLARAEFTQLRSTCARRGGSPSPGATRTTKGSTAQYYYDSAKTKNLIDTPDGIRFKGPPPQEADEENKHATESHSASKELPATAATTPTTMLPNDGISALVIAAESAESDTMIAFRGDKTKLTTAKA